MSSSQPAAEKPPADRPGPNLWVLGLGLLACVPLIWVLANAFGKDPRALPENTLGGKPAPTWTLTDLDGVEHDLEALRGTPVVLNVWASWCRPCLAEHPNLLQAADRYRGRVAFFGLSYDEDKDVARGWLARYGSNYPTLFDPGHLTAVDYGVTGVPETYFIDRDGVVHNKVVAPMSFPAIVEQLEEML